MKPGQTDILDLGGNGKGVAINIDSHGQLHEYTEDALAEVVDRGRMIYDLSDSLIYYGDGVTIGGIPLARGNNTVSAVTNRTDLSELNTKHITSAFLIENNRSGIFEFYTVAQYLIKTGRSLTADVLLDTEQGIFVASALDPTGASGAWVRKFSGAADVRWFGATLNGTDDTIPLSKALAVAGHVRVPHGSKLTIIAGQIVPPSGAFLHVVGEIAFEPAVNQTAFLLQDNISNFTVLGPGKITSSTDMGFLSFFKLQQVAGSTLDGLTVEGINFEYTATPTNSSDRWAFVGAGEGTRKNVRIHHNTLKGPMQLTATMVATGTFQDSEITWNTIVDARSNAISLLSSGLIGWPCTLKNVKVTDNTILTTQSLNSTSLGIAVGIDSTGSSDKNVNIQKLTIARNRFDLSASATQTADFFIRLGSNCAALGGFNSVADDIVVDDNVFTHGFTIDQALVASATLSRINGFAFSNNKCRSGDFFISHLADDAKFIGNTFSRDASFRMGVNNGKVYTKANIFGLLGVTDGNAEFRLYSSHDTFLGSTTGIDRVVTFNANAGKVQYGEFDHPTVNSSSTAPFGIRSGFYTTGAGNPQMHVRNPTSSSPWGTGLYEVGTGAITEHGPDNFSTAGTLTGGSVVSTGALNVGAESTFKRGDDSAASNGFFQHLLAFNATALFRHGIRTRHNGGVLAGNAIDFYLHKGDTAASGDTPALKIATLDAAAGLQMFGAFGYGPNVGGTVAQATSKTTGVTLNKLSGQITMNNAALAAGEKAPFTVTNSQIAATDVVIANVASGGTANAYRASVTKVAAGSFNVTVENITAGSLSEAPVINFAVIKA
jgi:hypothetical protein